MCHGGDGDDDCGGYCGDDEEDPAGVVSSHYAGTATRRRTVDTIRA